MDASRTMTGTVKKMRSSMAPPRRRAAAKPKANNRLAVPALDDGSGGGAGSGAGAGVAQSVDKHSLCTDILASGYVQSYVDFFYLTHRTDPNGDASSGQPPEIDVPLADMVFIKDNLTLAEESRRTGKTNTVYECFSNLAQHFQSKKDSKTGIYFHEKCLEIARLTHDAVAEMMANHNLGLAYDSLGNVRNAVRFHERHLELAQEHANADEQKVAHHQLVEAYTKLATSLEAENKLLEAVELHMRCLVSAKACDDRLAEGLANYRTGRAHVLLEQPDKGVPYLLNYLAITQELEGQEEGQGSAHAALAAAYQAMDEPEKAVDELEAFLKVADATSNVPAQSEACSNLGVMYNRRGDFDNAVKYFERAYELVRTLLSGGQGTRKMVDAARVNLGMARGNARMGSYLNVIQFDVRALLLWKNRRILPQEAK